MKFSFFKNQVRFRIALELIDKDEGISIMQLGKLLEDISQATLYRHVKSMLDDNLIKIVGVQKLEKGEEKLYSLNTEEYRISEEEWNLASLEEKIDFITYYFMYILHSYKNYNLNTDNEKNDKSTFSISKLSLNDNDFIEFQDEISDLLTKYYKLPKKSDSLERTVSLVIIP